MNRRNVLRAAGVSVALPALESLLPRPARAQSAAATKRFVALFFPNGSTMRQDWQLSGSGTNYTLGTAHASLGPLKNKFSIFKNLMGCKTVGSPSHSRGTSFFLTAAEISDMSAPKVGLSIDQAIAAKLAPNTKLRTLHLGPPPYAGGPPSDTGWPSGYNVNLSWSSRTEPNSPLENAQAAFDQVFTAGGGGGTDPTVAKQLRLKRSVLDFVIGQLNTITPKLGQDDGKKLDQYLTSVRDVERRLQMAEQMVPTGNTCNAGARPVATLAFPQHTRAMLDIIVLALQCDATRIVTYSMDYGFGNQDLNFLGHNFRHHNLSHGGTAPERLTAHKAMVKWYMDQLAYFIGRLDGVTDGTSGATLLDSSMVYMGSDVGDPWIHSYSDLTAILAGKGGGAFTPGRLIDASGKTYASLLLAFAHGMGAPLASFAGATAPFAGL